MQTGNQLKTKQVGEVSLLQLGRKLTTPAEFKDFLVALEKGEGFITKASKSTGVSPGTVYARLKQYPDFAEAVSFVRARWRRWRLERLEGVSFQEAQKPKNFKERKFLMEAFNPARYRATFRDAGPANINISFGFQVPQKRFGMDGKVESEENTIDAEEIPPEPSDDGLDDVDLVIE